MGIIWLASYPKSGNTWMRAFLVNYLRNEDTPVDINAFEINGIASAREIFNRYTGVNSLDLTDDEADALRPDVYLHQAKDEHADMMPDLQDLKMVKVHDAYTRLPDGRWLFPPEATDGVLYIIRNPLDVAVSYMHFFGQTMDRTIEIMADDRATYCASRRKPTNQLRQKFRSWHDHVRSWCEAPGLRRWTVRYEDMLASPEETFAAVLQFLGKTQESKRFEKALRFSRFDELQSQEAEVNFRERSPGAESFFRQGVAGGWRDILTSDQARRIIADHQDVMRTFGYLTDENEPTY